MSNVVTGEDIIRGKLACESSVLDTEMVRRRVLEIARNNSVVVQDGNKVAQEGEEERVHSSL